MQTYYNYRVNYVKEKAIKIFSSSIRNSRYAIILVSKFAIF